MSETGWLLEKGENPAMFLTAHGYFEWTTDANKAIRFSCREDAEMIALIVEDADRVIEHQWDDCKEQLIGDTGNE